MRIYLADLANQLFEIDNKVIPIGIGYVGAYCKQQLGDQVDVTLYRTGKQLLQALDNAPPDVVGFGSYDWNTNLTNAMAATVRKRFPRCLIVVGGANIDPLPEANKAYLAANPSVDYVVNGDGEFPFTRLVTTLLSLKDADDPIASIKAIPIDGARTLVGGEIVMGKPTDLVRDLSVVPSPYLMGMFDDLLQNPDLMPIVQNVRGCPYLCAYCVSGLQSSKIRAFSFDRVTSEVNYLRANAGNRFLRFSDDNFGIVEGDERLAEYLRESYDRDMYPIGLKAYSAKKTTERTRRIAEIMKPLMIMCISLQTTTPDVLKKTKRISASVPEARMNLDFARRRGIATGTELIFGLPGESLDSMKQVINDTVALRFDSIAMGPLWMLKGSELNWPQRREENGYRTKFMLAENAVTWEGDLFSVEVDEIVTSSNAFTFEEWQRFLGMKFLTEISLYFGYAREIVYSGLLFDVKATDIFEEIIDNPEKYPSASKGVRLYISNYISNLHDTREQALQAIFEIVSRGVSREELVSLSKIRIIYGLIDELIFSDKTHGFFDDLVRAQQAVYAGNAEQEFHEACAVVLDLAIKTVINPKERFVPVLPFESSYDIVRWVEDGYLLPLSDYKSNRAVKANLACRNPNTVSKAIQSDTAKGRTDNFHFFRYMNSTLAKRAVRSADDGVSFESPPHEVWRREERGATIIGI